MLEIVSDSSILIYECFLTPPWLLGHFFLKLLSLSRVDAVEEG